MIERYVYDLPDGSGLDDVALEFLDPDGNGAQPLALKYRYLHGPAVDQVLAQEDVTQTMGTAGRVLWQLGDNLGTTRDVVNNATVRVAHVKYDSFGQITAITDNNGAAISTALTRYLFTAREWDYDTKLQYNRARWYNPATGRWMSEDALSHAGSSDGDAPDPLRFVYSAASPTPGGWGEDDRTHIRKPDPDPRRRWREENDTSDDFYRGAESSSASSTVYRKNQPTSGGYGRMWGDISGTAFDLALKQFPYRMQNNTANAMAKFRTIGAPYSWAQGLRMHWSHGSGTYNPYFRTIGLPSDVFALTKSGMPGEWINPNFPKGWVGVVAEEMFHAYFHQVLDEDDLLYEQFNKFARDEFEGDELAAEEELSEWVKQLFNALAERDFAIRNGTMTVQEANLKFPLSYNGLYDNVDAIHEDGQNSGVIPEHLQKRRMSQGVFEWLVLDVLDPTGEAASVERRRARERIAPQKSINPKGAAIFVSWTFDANYDWYTGWDAAQLMLSQGVPGMSMETFAAINDDGSVSYGTNVWHGPALKGHYGVHVKFQPGKTDVDAPQVE